MYESLPQPLQAFFKSHGLEARLRPEDRYCKPTIARATRVTSLVLRVKRRRSKAKTPGQKELAAGREEEEEGGGGGVGRGPVDEGGAVGPEEREEEGSTRESRFEYSGEVLGVVQLSFEFTGEDLCVRVHNCTCSSLVPVPKLHTCTT